MIDVLYVVGQFGRGGTERQIALLATRSAQIGKKVAIAVLSPLPPELTHTRYPTPGVEVFQAERRFGKAVAFLQALEFTLRHRPRVVHSFTFQLNFYAYLLARSCNAAVLGSVRSGFDKLREDTPELVWRLCLRYPGIIACNSGPAARRVAMLEPPWAPHTTLVVPNAIDLERFGEPVDHGPRQRIRILGVGNLREEKRWHVAIDAVARLSARQNCAFTILGTGALRAALERQIAELGLHEIVTLPGSVELVDEYLHDSDVLLHTAGSEGSPNAIIEGMSAGLACIATGVGEVPALLAENRGIVVPSDDLNALGGALERLCESHDLRRQLGAAARRYAERALDVGARIVEWERIYDALANGEQLKGFDPVSSSS